MKKLFSLLLLLALLTGCTTAAPAETTLPPTEAPVTQVTETTAPPETTAATEET